MPDVPSDICLASLGMVSSSISVYGMCYNFPGLLSWAQPIELLVLVPASLIATPL